jgi:hypothetical protein
MSAKDVTVELVQSKLTGVCGSANSWDRDCVPSRSRADSLRKRCSAEFVMYIPLVDQLGRIWALGPVRRDYRQVAETSRFLTTMPCPFGRLGRWYPLRNSKLPFWPYRSVSQKCQKRPYDVSPHEMDSRRAVR